MFGTGIKTILASGILAVSMMGVSAPVANAASGQISISFAGQEDFKVQKIGYRHGHQNFRKHGRRHGSRHGYRHGGRRGHGQGCSPRRAVNKAWNMGLNHPHVKRVGRRHIVVKGGFRGSRAKVVFSRYGGCQVVNFERKHW